jgi:hypothetical protein
MTGIYPVIQPGPALYDNWIKSGNFTIKTTPEVLSDSYRVTGNEGYVRIYISETADDKQEAWSQPIFIT